VNIGDNPGTVVFQYLTGAGRGLGDPTAVINHVSLTDTLSGNIFETVISPERDVKLNGFTQQSVNLNITPASSITTSLLFNTYLLEIDSLHIDNGAGGFSSIPPIPTGSPLVAATFPANIRAFRGRQTNVAIRLDDTMFAISGSSATFDPDAFDNSNLFPASGSTINSTLGDYLMFDVSAVAAPPQLAQSATPASRVYFTGDNFAVSTATPGEFDVLTPVGFVQGTFTNPIHSGPVTTPGTFTLVQPDPRDPDPGTALRITALEGVWKPVTDVVSNMGTFTALSMPSSQDNNIQTILLIARSGSTITNMYFGQIDLAAKTLQAFPIADVSPGSTDNEIDGTVSNLVDVSGNTASDPTLVRKGSYSLTVGTIPVEFPSTGTFVVYRR
jgi:hypothetical protein